MTVLMERTGTTRENLHAGVMAIYEAAKSMVAEGRRPHIELTEEGDTLTLRQLRFLHGPVFRQIAEQVVVNGVRYTPKTWKTHLKELFIPDEFEMVQAPFVRDRQTGEWRPGKRPVPRKLPKSLTSLKNEARSNFIDEVLAHAAVNWGVEFVFKFDEREAVRYVPPRSKQKAAQLKREAVPA